MTARAEKGRRGYKGSALVWGGAAALLALPLVAMRFTREVAWTASDFAVMGAMLFAACGAWELATRASGSLAYRAGAGIATISAGVRRIHDHDKTGWLLLLSFVPLFGWIFLLIMTLTPGTRGENSYGYDPREGDAPSADEMAAIFS